MNNNKKELLYLKKGLSCMILSGMIGALGLSTASIKEPKKAYVYGKLEDNNFNEYGKVTYFDSEELNDEINKIHDKDNLDLRIDDCDDNFIIDRTYRDESDIIESLVYIKDGYNYKDPYQFLEHDSNYNDIDYALNSISLNRAKRK